MSIAALLQAARDQIQLNLGLDNTDCDVQPSDRPPPLWGKQYIAVYTTSWRPDRHVTVGLSEQYGIGVMIAQRTPATPPGKFMGNLYLKAIAGLEPVARSIINILHFNYDFIGVANTYIGTAFQIIEPMEIENANPTPQERYSEWAWSDSEDDMNKICAISIDLRFAGAARYTTLTGSTANYYTSEDGTHYYVSEDGNNRYIRE